jgi:alpha-ketoglutarate-dependent taurine dioxygenase
MPEELLMPITVCPVTPGFVAEIGDIDLSMPLEPSDLLAVKEAFTTYAVLIFPDQHLSQGLRQKLRSARDHDRAVP